LTKLYSNSLLILGIIEDVDISKIKRSFYLYRNCENDDLYESIKEKGLLQPIIVRPLNDYFEIVAGNRRYDVCKKLGWKKLICHIVEVDDKEAFEISLIENIQRKNLDPIEQAHCFKNYIDSYGWGGISELALKIGKSVAYVDRRLKLLELPADVIESISLSNISASAAEELITLKDKGKQTEIAKLIKEKEISSRAVRNMVKDIKKNNSSIYYSRYDFDGNDCSPTLVEDINRKTQKVFDKSITILKITSQKLAQSISEIEDNWIAYELLMQHKLVVDRQIDLLIKQKKKL
jgi:ParB family transcriptional regulator, chromosome partitioning protein